jgi:lipopolysaccharide export system permease protein
MKILDRYVVRLFLINFVILAVAFLFLFLVVDLIVDLDEFLEAGRVRAEEFGGVLWATLWTIWDYYGPVFLLLYVFFSGLLVVGAMGFSFAGLTRSGELVAMLTSGISVFRLAAPVVVVGCGLNALTLPLQEAVIPRFAHKLTRSKSQVRHEAISAFEVLYAVDGRGRLLSAARFDPTLDQPMLSGVTILDRDARGRTVRRVTAEQAFWEEGRGGWELVGGLAIRPSWGGEEPAGAGGRQVGVVGFFATDLSPQVLLAERASIYPRLLSFVELNRLASNPAVESGLIRQIMHSRFSVVILNVLILVMALRFFLQREPTRTLRQGVAGAAAALGAWGAGLMILQAGSTQLNPVAAAWLPVVIFLPISAVMLQTIKS